MTATARRSTIAHGTIILFYNRLTRYDDADLLRHFRRATRNEIAMLIEGGSFWRLERPAPGVKASGFAKCEVVGFRGENISYISGSAAKFTLHDENVYLVADETPLLAAIANDPRVTDMTGNHKEGSG